MIPRLSPILLALIALALPAPHVARGSSATTDAALVDASHLHLQPGQPAEFSIACRVRADSVDVLIEGDRVVLCIDSARGRGSAAITRKSEHWPEELVLRFNMSALESVKLTCGGESIEDPETQAYDSTGKPVQRSAGSGGHYDLRVPRSLLAGTDDKTLIVTWADYYRH